MTFSLLSRGRHHYQGLFQSVYALLIGAGLVPSFAPWSWWWLQCVLLPLCLALWRHAPTAVAAARLGWCTGVAYFMAGIFWLTHSMSVYGDIPFAVTVFLLFLFAALLALSFALFAYAYQRARTAHWPQAYVILIGAVTWGVIEYLRGTVLNGFPWLALGYAHTASPLAGYAPWLGVYGISALIMGLALGVDSLYLQRHQRGRAWRGGWIAIGLLFGLGALGQLLRFTEATTAIKVSLIQTQVPQESKFSPALVEAHLTHYAQLINQAQGELIVTPETILPMLFTDLPATWWSRLNLAQRTLALGSFALLGNQISNSVLAVRDKDLVFRYDKAHLVPLGEYVPLGFGWLVAALRIPLGSLGAGAPMQKALDVAGIPVAFNVCYENLFGAELATQVRHNQAQVLVNVSNLAWFGQGYVLAQHAQISQMRALELQKPFLAATNSGLTMQVDTKGQISAALPIDQAGILEVEVYGAKGLTPYGRFGDALAAALAALLLLGCGAHYLIRRQQTKTIY